MNVVMETSIRCCNRNDVASASHQLCEERKMWTIYDRMVAFPQPPLEVVKTFKDMTFYWYAG